MSLQGRDISLWFTFLLRFFLSIRIDELLISAPYYHDGSRLNAANAYNDGRVYYFMGGLSDVRDWFWSSLVGMGQSVCVSQWKKGARRMASTTSDTGDTSSKQQQAQCKENYNKGPFHQSITAILTEEKREEKQFTKSTHVAVYLFRDLDFLCVF